MKARTEIEAGICGFRTMVDADSPDAQNVTFSIQSDCEKIRTLGEKMKDLEPVDAYMEIHPNGPGILLNAARETLLGCCAGCIVPAGIFKSMQVAAEIALPRDMAIRIQSAE